MFETVRACRLCGHGPLEDLLDLGQQPLANGFVPPGQKDIKTFPLTAAFCPKCSLFQIKETVRKEVLFDRYFWVTQTSKQARQYAQFFAGRVSGRLGLKRGDLVFEIASNDATVLKQFQGRGMPVVGIDPARNLAEKAVGEGVPTECAYWDADTAKRLTARYGRPAAIVARNVVPHVSDLHGVVQGIADALDEEGSAVIEFHHGMVIARQLHYDSIYHEHLCYLTAHSLERLLNRHGLYSYAADKSPINGGSLAVYCSKERRAPEPGYVEVIEEEAAAGLQDGEAWRNFARQAQVHRRQTQALLETMKGTGMAGFGASARSCTFMNFCGIGKDHLKAVIDNNPLKQGFMTPAGDVPIVSFKQGMALKPEVIFILAWNFADEIMEACAACGFRGKYVWAFPGRPRILDLTDSRGVCGSGERTCT